MAANLPTLVGPQCATGSTVLPTLVGPQCATGSTVLPGGVLSINGQTGVVVLNADDVVSILITRSNFKILKALVAQGLFCVLVDRSNSVLYLYKGGI
ncbi:putative collagen-like protein [Paenibacillus sp. 598K]|nr:putative collagen-like protein [Paenibacillus sp. 598K]